MQPQHKTFCLETSFFLQPTPLSTVRRHVFSSCAIQRLCKPIENVISSVHTAATSIREVSQLAVILNFHLKKLGTSVKDELNPYFKPFSFESKEK